MAESRYMSRDTRGIVCVVTGANSGIGFVTARELAVAGADVIMVCRDRARGEAAREQIALAGDGSTPELLLCDFAELASVRGAAERIGELRDHVDVLANNAGMIAPHRMETVDGHELTLQVNHLAPFLLTRMLNPLLEAAPSARVVTVSSGAHEFMRKGMIFDDIDLEHGWGSFKAYAQSKLANVLFSYELCARLGGTDITSNCMHPGAVRSGFGKGLGGASSFFLALSQPFLRSSEKGAETLIYLAQAAEVEGISGGYFHDMQPIDSSKASRDPAAATRLWEISAEMVGAQ